MRADFHTHSLFSFDGDPAATVTALCESAVRQGLTHLAITDHCDINGELEGIYATLDKDAVFAAVTEAKNAYAGHLTVLFGIELGQATQYPAEAKALLNRYPYDIVLGSLHNLAGERDFFYMDFRLTDEAQIAALFDRVLEESITLLDFPGIHVLTHLTYMHRYVKRAGREMDFAPFAAKLDRLFAKMIEKGIALEVNTSTLTADGTGITMPPQALLARYRAAGGTLLSVGSDAHHPAEVAQHFDHARRILLDCGFTNLAVPTVNGTLTFPIPL